MAIWWLAPQAPTALVWKPSAQRVQVLVRAHTSWEALALAVAVFKDHLVSPSALDVAMVHDLVACHYIVGSGYPAQGPSAILEVTGQDSEPDVE
jgi:hypothetical protein